MPKRIIILAAVATVSFLFWVVVRPWVLDPTWSAVNYHTWLWPLLLLMVTGAVVGSALTLLDIHWYRLGVTGIVAAAFLFVFGITRWNLVAVLALFLFHFWAIRSMRNALYNHVKVDFRAAVMAGIRNVITPLLIMISFVYFANPDVQASAQQNRLPQSITKAVETVSRFVVRTELGGLSPVQQTQATNQLAKEVTSFLNQEAGPYRKYFPPVLAFGLFLVLQGLGFIFIPVAGYMALGLYHILKSVRFLKITEKDVKAEVLSI